MTYSCAVRGCKSKYVRGGPIHFFSFPKESGQRCKWIDFCQSNKRLNPAFARICSLHFAPDAFQRNLMYELLNLEVPRFQIRFKKDAVPTLNLPTLEPELSGTEELPSNVVMVEDVKKEEADITIKEEAILPLFPEDDVAITPEDQPCKGIKRTASCDSLCSSEISSGDNDSSNKETTLSERTEKMGIAQDAPLPAASADAGRSDPTNKDAQVSTTSGRGSQPPKSQKKAKATPFSPETAETEMEDLSFEEEGFYNLIQESDRRKIVIRSNIETIEEAEKWISVFIKKFKVDAKVVKDFMIHGRCTLQSTRESYYSTVCVFTLDVSIMPKNSKPKKPDLYAKHLSGVIVIKGKRRRSTKDDNFEAFLEELHAFLKKKEHLYKYFLSSKEAQSYEEKLNQSFSDLANHMMKPSKQAISHLREVWEAERLVSLKRESVFNAIRKYASETKSARIQFQEDDGKFVAVLVTDFMLRIHRAFNEARNMVFVESTVHTDVHNTTVTMLLCAAPSGPAPLGVVFTSSHGLASYEKGFLMLKDVLGDGAFCGSHPICFITDMSETIKFGLRKVWPDSAIYRGIYHILQQVWTWLCDDTNAINKEHRFQLLEVAKQLMYSNSETEFRMLWNKYYVTPESVQYPMYTRYLSVLLERRHDWNLLHRQVSNLSNCYISATITIIVTMCIVRDAIAKRCRGFTTNQLIIFMAEVFDPFMQECLTAVAEGRTHLKPFATTSSGITDIVQNEGSVFWVNTEAQREEESITYKVDMQTGICGCTWGQTDGVCIHQLACAEMFVRQLPMVVKCTPLERKVLAAVAHGNMDILCKEQAKTISEPVVTYVVYPPIAPAASENVSTKPVSNAVDKIRNSNYLNVAGTKKAAHTVNSKPQKAAQRQNRKSQKVGESVNSVPFLDCLHQVICKYADNSTKAAFATAIDRLNSVRSTSELNSVLHAMGSSLSGNHIAG